MVNSSGTAERDLVRPDDSNNLLRAYKIFLRLAEQKAARLTAHEGDTGPAERNPVRPESGPDSNGRG